uniref:Uncharacterized protein n=1 Tax=Siphoviridae sp. ctWT735 TaxID=2825538 RepID=A0A8S5TUB8_9CAUD|nr:MAG TPA: hypothetical protein [Siphoviridae sp. ctWT735]
MVKPVRRRPFYVLYLYHSPLGEILAGYFHRKGGTTYEN